MEASNSAEMDGSVAALFEEPRPPASLQASLDQSSEELKQLLMRATMDLETTQSQAKIYESELCHTKNLLKNARQERDAAREEVVKLKESFFSSSWLSNADVTAAVLPNNSGLLDSHTIRGGDAHEYSLHIQHSSKASSSPGQHMQLDCISSSIMLDASKTHLSDLHWDLHDLPALRPVYPDVQSNNLSPLLCGRGAKAASGAAAVVSMEMDQQSDHEHMQQESAIFTEANELLEQEVQLAGFQGQEAEANDDFSINNVIQRQTGAVQQWGSASDIVGVVTPHMVQQEDLKRPNEDHILMHNQRNEKTSSVGAAHGQSDIFHLASLARHRFKEAIGFAELPTEVNVLNEFLSCTDGANGSANMSVEDQLDVQEEATTTLNLNTIDIGLSMDTPWQASEYGDMQVSNCAAIAPSSRCVEMENGALYGAAPKHLPEPPESDPEVMLRSLPERGKLLQAVMQAGPLLQTLLLAGPLPRWRRPPPAVPVDPMESRLMMQCCNNVGNNSMSYNYSMHNPHFPTFPISPSLAMGASLVAERSKSCAGSTYAMAAASSASAAALATWMTAEMSLMPSMATTTRMTTAMSTTTTTMIGPKADQSAGLTGGRGDVSGWMSSTVMEPSLLNIKSKSSSTGPMLNTSTNLSYSNRLLRSSALLPKRLIFNNKHRSY